MLAAFAADPAAGVQALVLEHLAVSLNPRQGLAAGERLARMLARTGRHGAVLAAFAAELDQMPWRLYEVRRVIRPRRGDPSRPASASRSLRGRGHGSRAQMTAFLREVAGAYRAPVIADAGGIERAWLRERGDLYPVTEHYFVAAPAGALDKEGPGFADTWRQALEHPAGQLRLVA